MHSRPFQGYGDGISTLTFHPTTSDSKQALRDGIERLDSALRVDDGVSVDAVSNDRGRSRASRCSGSGR